MVGPSGSGKTSIGRQLFGGDAFYTPAWGDGPIVDGIAPGGDFDAVTGALASVGLGNVPSWLRPYAVLSMGEKFRADLARLVIEAPRAAVVDEFTSVVDRQIASVGALAFQKAWRRNKGRQVVLLTPHYDVLDWLEPDWIFDTNKGAFVEARACRLVVKPAWQGAGVGMRFLNWCCELQRTGGDGCRLAGRKSSTIFHTSHPGLVAALLRDPRWRRLSAVMHGGNKAKSMASINRKKTKLDAPVSTGYGGHFRAVQGFRYYGPRD